MGALGKGGALKGPPPDLLLGREGGGVRGRGGEGEGEGRVDPLPSVAGRVGEGMGGGTGIQAQHPLISHPPPHSTPPAPTSLSTHPSFWSKSVCLSCRGEAGGEMEAEAVAEEVGVMVAGPISSSSSTCHP